jgi:hypothetical protein
MAVGGGGIGAIIETATNLRWLLSKENTVKKISKILKAEMAYGVKSRSQQSGEKWQPQNVIENTISTTNINNANWQKA